MDPVRVAFLLFGEPGSLRDARTEDKYAVLAAALDAAGFAVETLVYHDEISGDLETPLAKLDAVLVWVNPIESGHDRGALDALLRRVAERGVHVSAHPDTIVKMGTKDVLYKTRRMDWGIESCVFSNPEDFRRRFLDGMRRGGIRVLKLLRGNGGNGVFKVSYSAAGSDEVAVQSAVRPFERRVLTVQAFHDEFCARLNPGVLIDQAWNPNIANGMVRCYLSGPTVVGFGYQEVNALCPDPRNPDGPPLTPTKRYYYGPDCGLFQDLRLIMEEKWVPDMLAHVALGCDDLPLIWDADFFIDKVNAPITREKYSLCEINVSCVSPFPESAVPYMVERLRERLRTTRARS